MPKFLAVVVGVLILVSFIGLFIYFNLKPDTKVTSVKGYGGEVVSWDPGTNILTYKTTINDIERTYSSVLEVPAVIVYVAGVLMRDCKTPTQNLLTETKNTDWEKAFKPGDKITFQLFDKNDTVKREGVVELMFIFNETPKACARL